jgi:magnesium-transporting ATPase (P-type)
MEKPPSRKRWQFGLGSLMLFVTLFAVLMSALGGMIRIQSGEKIALPHSFLIMAIAAPMGMVIVISVFLAVKQWYERRKK